jgi:protein-S-isoprenylcysteine O-methyltransferase
MVLTTLLGYFLLVVFFCLEGRLRRGAAAKSCEAGEFDRRTTLYIGYAYFISSAALLAAWLLISLRLGRMPYWAAWLGVVFALAGPLMRTWANHVLGGFYTRTLQATKDQTIVRNGPYRLIRHPGYLGMILMWIGVSAASGNWIALLVVLCVIAAAYHYRIQNEEKMLLGMLPGYAEYSSTTWKLLPPIY